MASGGPASRSSVSSTRAARRRGRSPESARSMRHGWRASASASRRGTSGSISATSWTTFPARFKCSCDSAGRSDVRPILLAVLLAMFAQARVAFALEVQVKTVKTAAQTVQASIEIVDLVPERFKRTLEDNGTLHLRLQAELWESRPVWDRLVYPALVRAARPT